MKRYKEIDELLRRIDSLHAAFWCVLKKTGPVNISALAFADAYNNKRRVIDERVILKNMVMTVHAREGQKRKRDRVWAPCMICGEPVHGVPDGLALCDACADKEGK